MNGAPRCSRSCGFPRFSRPSRFSVAITVRGETERTSTLAEGVRAYYLATGALERALAYIEWGPGHKNPDNTPRYFEPGMARLNMDFPSGVATVEIIPESSKFDINSIKPEELQRLLMNLGADPARAQLIASAVQDWRSPAPPGGISMFDQQYLSGVPSFRSRHASLEETEELLLVKGMTPELYHGGFVRDAAGRLQPQAGSERLRVCVRISGSIRYQLGSTRCYDHDRNQSHGRWPRSCSGVMPCLFETMRNWRSSRKPADPVSAGSLWVATRFLRFAPRPGCGWGKAATRTWRAPSARFTSFTGPDIPLGSSLYAGMTTTDGLPRERSR